KLVVRKIGRRHSPDALSGRIRRDQLGMRALQFLEAAHQLIEIVVGYGRIGKNVITMLMIAYPGAKFVDLNGEVIHGKLNSNHQDSAIAVEDFRTCCSIRFMSK